VNVTIHYAGGYLRGGFSVGGDLRGDISMGCVLESVERRRNIVSMDRMSGMSQFPWLSRH